MNSGFGQERKLPRERLAWLRLAVIAVCVLLLVGFWRLQVLRSDYYAQLAERNRIRTLPIMAPRGLILDRNGRVLVDNYPAFSVILLREDVPQARGSLEAIARGLNLDAAWLAQRLEDFGDAPPYFPIVLKDEASLADIAFIEAHRSDFPELELLMMYRRRYPPDGFGSHLFGHVGEASADEVASGRYELGDVIGKKGIERYYNNILQGVNGQRRAMVDSRGHEVRGPDYKPEYKPPAPGRPIRLTIDYDLQRAAEDALAGRKGALVALNPQNGDVLALVSHPAFDPNLFAGRIPPEEWKRLLEDPEKPLLNRVTQAQLAPGSVFKVIIAAAGLEEGLFKKPFTVHCTGSAVHYDRVFRCWVPEGHGTVGLHRAIVRSCDVFFYEVGKQLGIERIAYYAEKLGLGRPTGIDLPAEEGGLIPSPAWKQRVRKQEWWPGETISVAIGQGPIMVTPLQLAHTLGGMASGGVFVRPRLVLEPANRTDAEPERHVSMKERTVAALTRGMWGVVNEDGTGVAARLPDFEVAGKTGTAQLVALNTLRQVEGQRHLRDNAWFVGMAPARNPEIVVAVLLEHGEHGASAAPLARAVLRTYHEKKQGETPMYYTRTLASSKPGAR
ncbi:MAG: penicillin-binding protein 2 [Acidobacteria bacterium]|nr:penicillin-binding protein 2 [Acidobacteriota bacterium]